MPCPAMDLGSAKPSHRVAIFIFLFSIFNVPLVAAQTQNPPAKIPGDLGSDLKEFVETPSVSGYEQELTEKIRAKLASFHPVADNLGDVVVTIGSGAPHRLIVTPIDEPGFVVSGITDDGYLRLQRLPQSGLPPIFNELYSAQPVKIGTANGKWIDGVVAGLSVHLQTGARNHAEIERHRKYVRGYRRNAPRPKHAKPAWTFSARSPSIASSLASGTDEIGGRVRRR